MKFHFFYLLLIPYIGFTQNYTSFFTGNTIDVVKAPSGGICIMGGATEDDRAMKWFLQKVNGGDVLVLRASGSNGYNDYLYSSLGIPVNSVETIVCHNASASSDPYILQKIQQAEAIWFAGGDQWKYISYWRNTPIDSMINQAIKKLNIAIGCTSAGMAIQGKYYFSAQNGTVTSTAALANPYNNLVTVDSKSFIENAILKNVITDTHFDNPDRKGRLVTFLAKIAKDYNVNAKAIACDEYTAVCIEPNGIAHVFGGFPKNDDNAYFIQTNCELANQYPENCNIGEPLTWNLGSQAIKVYQIKGDSSGNKTFDLNNWKSGNGGTWFDWSVVNGSFTEKNGNPINCTSSSYEENLYKSSFKIYPNPTSGSIIVASENTEISKYHYVIINSVGQNIPFKEIYKSIYEMQLDLSTSLKGVYNVVVFKDDNKIYNQMIIKD